MLEEIYDKKIPIFLQMYDFYTTKFHNNNINFEYMKLFDLKFMLSSKISIESTLMCSLQKQAS